MKRLIPKPPHYDYDHYPEDVRRIVRVCEQNGFLITYDDAKDIWQSHSEDYAAGWLILPKDDQSLFDEVFRCSMEVE